MEAQISHFAEKALVFTSLQFHIRRIVINVNSNVRLPKLFRISFMFSCLVTTMVFSFLKVAYVVFLVGVGRIYMVP